MRSVAEPKDKTDEWIARLVPDKSFVDIGGIGVGVINERITSAYSAGARSCAMADIMPTSHYEWDIFRKKCASLGLPAFREFGGVDIRSRESLRQLGRVDIVHSTGI